MYMLLKYILTAELELMENPRTINGVVKSEPSGLIPKRIMLLTTSPVPTAKSIAVMVAAGFTAVTSKLWIKFLEIKLVPDVPPL